MTITREEMEGVEEGECWMRQGDEGGRERE
jgi:hypothetical protein